jgi:hypothetical protein
MNLSVCGCNFFLKGVPARRANSGVASMTPKSSHFGPERPFEVNFALSPVQIGRYQLRNIGIDGKVPQGIDACRSSQSQASHEDQPCMARAKTNKRYNSPCQHRFSFYFCGQLGVKATAGEAGD